MINDDAFSISNAHSMLVIDGLDVSRDMME